MHGLGIAVISIGAVAAVAVMGSGFRTYGRRAIEALRRLDTKGF